MKTTSSTTLRVPLMVAITAGVIATAQFAYSQNLITNGDFETAGFLTGWTSGPQLPGATIGQALGPGPDTTLGATFSSTNTNFATLSQTFATTPGAFYTLTFFYQVEGTTPPLANNGFDVLWNGVSIGGGLFPQFNVNPGNIMPTYTLQATGAFTTLEFDGRNANFVDFLDNVSVTAVPDTGASAVLLATGLIGLAATRRVLA